MHTVAGLLDIHTRSHRSMLGLMTHCAALPAGMCDRSLKDFAYPTLREQFYHVIAAERYWIGVLEGRIQVDDDPEAYPDMPSLLAMRARVAGHTAAHFGAQTDASVNTPRILSTWDRKEVSLRPAHVLLRFSVHIYDHKGQVSSMCRALGKPIPAGLDFPLA